MLKITKDGNMITVEETLHSFDKTEKRVVYYDMDTYKSKVNNDPWRDMTQSSIDWVVKHYLPKVVTAHEKGLQAALDTWSDMYNRKDKAHFDDQLKLAKAENKLRKLTDIMNTSINLLRYDMQGESPNSAVIELLNNLKKVIES